MMASALTAAAAVPAARLRGARRMTGTRRIAAAPFRGASSSAVTTAVPTANPLAGVQLFDVNGQPKTVPFWSEDQTVVVTFLRHFG